MRAFLFFFPMEFSLIILFFHYFLKLVRLNLFFLVSIGELTLRVFKLVRSGGSEVMIMTRETVGNQPKRFPAQNPLNGQIDLFSHKTKKIMKKSKLSEKFPLKWTMKTLTSYQTVTRRSEKTFCSRKYGLTTYLSFLYIYFIEILTVFPLLGLTQCNVLLSNAKPL